MPTQHSHGQQGVNTVVLIYINRCQPRTDIFTGCTLNQDDFQNCFQTTNNSAVKCEAVKILLHHSLILFMILTTSKPGNTTQTMEPLFPGRIRSGNRQC